MQPVEGWNTANVTDMMIGMFTGAGSFNQAVEGWATVTPMAMATMGL